MNALTEANRHLLSSEKLAQSNDACDLRCELMNLRCMEDRLTGKSINIRRRDFDFLSVSLRWKKRCSPLRRMPAKRSDFALFRQLKKHVFKIFVEQACLLAQFVGRAFGDKFA